MASSESSDEVELSLNKSQLLAMLKRAASKKRTVIEFRTVTQNGETKLDSAMDITDHVAALEDKQNTNPPTHE